MEKVIRTKARSLSLRLRDITPEDISNHGFGLRTQQYVDGAAAFYNTFQQLRGSESWIACIDPSKATWAALVCYKLTNDEEKPGAASLILATAQHTEYNTDCTSLLLALITARSAAAGHGVPHFHSSIEQTVISNDATRIGAGLETYVQNIGSHGFQLPAQLQRPHIQLSFELQYQNDLANIHVERRPRLHFFLSRDLCRSVHIVEVKNEARKVELGSIVFDADCMLPYVPRDARLNIHVYSDIRNKDQDWCGNQAGLCGISLSQLLSKKSHTLELCIPTDNNSSKGRVLLRNPKLRCTYGLQQQDPRPPVPASENDAACAAAVMDYIRSCFDTFKRINPTWAAIKNIHAYMYHAQAGKLPAALFDVTQVTPSSEAYYLNLLDIVLARDDHQRAWFMSSATEKQVAHYTTEMVTVYVNWCKYITDKVFTSKRGQSGAASASRLTESFDCVRARGRLPPSSKLPRDNMDAADCEDFAKESLAQLHELKAGIWKSKELQRIQRSCKQFIDGVCLGGVSSMKLDGHIEKVGSMGAHEYLQRIPCYIFFNWLRAFNPEHPLLLLTSKKRQTAGAGMEFLLAEGTGLLYPSATAVVSKSARSWLEKGQKSLFEQLRKRYTFQHGSESTFYKTCNTFFTNDFLLKGLPYTEFMFAYNKNNTPTYGVTFQDVTLLSSKNLMIPQNRLSPLLRLACKRILKDNYPLEPFTPPTAELLRQHTAHKIVKTLQQAGGKELGGEHHELVYFLRRGDAQPELIASLKRCIQSKSGLSVSVKPELALASGVGGFYLVFHVPK